MTLKNSSISIEKLTHILRCKIVWRSRFAICILIFSTCILLGLNNCFAQQFLQQRVANYYQDDKYLDLSSDQAYLIYDYKPTGTVTNASLVSSADIKTLVDTQSYNHIGVFGVYHYVTVDGVTYQRCLSVITPSHIIFEAGTSVGTLLPQIQELLQQKNLGTVAQRRQYITSSKSSIFVLPSDFRGYLQPWIISGLVIAILIPAWYLFRRFLRG